MSPCRRSVYPFACNQGPLIAAALIGLTLTGCSESEQISRYSVPKDQSDRTSADRDDGPATAWIYKLVGPADAVADEREKFDELVRSTVVSSSAKWTTPEGWTQQPGSGLRFATLVVDGSDPALEVSVTKLPLFGGRDDYLLQNINRWRGQVGLPAMQGGDWLAEATAAGEVEQTDVEDQDVTIVALPGKTAEIEDALMLAAIFLPKSSPRGDSRPVTPPPRSSSSPDRGSPLTFEAPEQWQPGKKSVMRVAAFLVSENDKQVEITVISAGGDLLLNVNRWRGQIALDPWTDQQLKESSEELSVGGAAASYFRLEGAEETILAAVLPDGAQSWFFKLTGDPDLAKREEQRFKGFVESVRLTSK